MPKLLSEVYGIEPEFKSLKVGDFVRLERGNIYMLTSVDCGEVQFVCVYKHGSGRPTRVLPTRCVNSGIATGDMYLSRGECRRMLDNCFTGAEVISQAEALAAMALNDVQ